MEEVTGYKKSPGIVFFVPLIFPCNVYKETRAAQDLRIVGEVAKLEYDSLAFIKEKTGRESELNKK